MSAEEKKATAETPAEKPPEKDQKSSSKPRLRGGLKFKTWEEKERWEKIRRVAGLL